MTVLRLAAVELRRVPSAASFWLALTFALTATVVFGYVLVDMLLRLALEDAPASAAQLGAFERLDELSARWIPDMLVSMSKEYSVTWAVPLGSFALSGPLRRRTLAVLVGSGIPRRPLLLATAVVVTTQVTAIQLANAGAMFLLATRYGAADSSQPSLDIGWLLSGFSLATTNAVMWAFLGLALALVFRSSTPAVLVAIGAFVFGPALESWARTAPAVREAWGLSAFGVMSTVRDGMADGEVGRVAIAATVMVAHAAVLLLAATFLFHRKALI